MYEKEEEKNSAVIQMCGRCDSRGETPGRGAESPPDRTDSHKSSPPVLQTPVCIAFGPWGYCERSLSATDKSTFVVQFFHALNVLFSKRKGGVTRRDVFRLTLAVKTSDMFSHPPV